MQTLFMQTILFLVTMLTGAAQASTLDDIRALEAGKTYSVTPPALRHFSLTFDSADNAVPSTLSDPVWFRLHDDRKVNLRDWTVVLFMQSACQYCQQFAPVLKTFSRDTGLSVFPVSLDGRGDTVWPDVLPATPDVMVEFFQSGVPVATPTTFLTNVNTMETWPMVQGVVSQRELTARLDAVLTMSLDRQHSAPATHHTQGDR